MNSMKFDAVKEQGDKLVLGIGLRTLSAQIKNHIYHEIPFGLKAVSI